MIPKVDASLFDTGPVVVVTWGPINSNEINPMTFATPNVTDLLGYSLEELFSDEFQWIKLMHPDDINRVMHTIESKMGRGITKFSDQYRLIKKNGDVCWINDHTQLTIGDNGELLGMIGYICDVTDLIEAQKSAEKQRIDVLAAEASSKNKTQFLANMSHEIRTPMNGVVGMADILTHTDLTDNQKSIVDTIISSGNALITIINDILDYSKIDNGKIELEQHPFYVEDVIQDVANLLRTGLINSTVDILTRIPPGLNTYVLGDEVRFRQILLNLVGNAIKFTSTGHVLIDLKAQHIDGQVKLEIDIVDTGIGIAPEKIDKIFEKFSQADNSTTREYGGTGLGLAISLSLSKLMDGGISVKSEIGTGSTFTVSLSLPSAGESKKDTIKTVISLPQTVLVLDDNQVNLDIVKEQMSYMGHQSIGFDTPKKALKAIMAAKQKNIGIDVLLIDFHMPKIDGEQFFKFIKSNNLCSYSRVIFLTSNCDDGLRIRLLNMGAEAVLTKPVSSNNLRDALATTHVEKRHSITPKLENDVPGGLILVVEDNKVNQMFYEQALRQMGYKFKIVDDGQKVVDAWQALKPEIILMDISMPKLNGKEATQKIRELEREQGLAETPIIAATAHAYKQDEEECLLAGMNDYLSKPMTIAALKEKIELFFPKKENLTRKQHIA